MAQPIDEQDVMELTIEGTNEGTPWAWVRHYRPTAIVTPETWLQMVHDQFTATVLTPLKALLSTLWFANCITITRAAPGPRVAYYTDFAPPLQGAVATDGVPNQTAVLIRLQTDVPGRRFQGRSYIPGLPEASTNGGLLTAAAAPGWITWADTLMTPLVGLGNTATPLVFSRTAYNPDADPPQPANEYSAEITNTEVLGNLAVIRRRRPKKSSYGA